MIGVEEERIAGRHGPHEDRCRSRNQRRRTQQIARSNVAHANLTAVSREHVDAQQAVNDDGQSFSVCFRIYGVAGWELDDPPAADQRFDGRNRNRGPTSDAGEVRGGPQRRGRYATDLVRAPSVQIRTKSPKAPLQFAECRAGAGGSKVTTIGERSSLLPLQRPSDCTT